MGLQTVIVGEDGEQVITVFKVGQEPKLAHSSHPQFEEIVRRAQAGDESVFELFDLAETAAKKFERLSDRISVRSGRLYLDGEEVHNVLADQIVRRIKEGEENFQPLVKFYENLLANPSEHSREQAYGWLSTHDFAITDDGLIVGYKGVRTKDDGSFESIFDGRAIVDGEEITGYIPQKQGSVIEMPRGEVTFDPTVGCSVGLHVGTYAYAEDFAQGALLEVHVNPRDIVSVPTESSHAKMRVCRYTVVDTIDKPYTQTVVSRTYDNDDFEWGDGEDDEMFEGEDLEFEGEDLDLSDDGPTDAPIAEGDQFEDTDSRRKGRTLTVKEIVGDHAIVESKNAFGITRKRKVKLDRLNSRKYRRV